MGSKNSAPPEPPRLLAYANPIEMDRYGRGYYDGYWKPGKMVKAKCYYTKSETRYGGCAVCEVPHPYDEKRFVER